MDVKKTSYVFTVTLSTGENRTYRKDVKTTSCVFTVTLNTGENRTSWMSDGCENDILCVYCDIKYW